MTDEDKTPDSHKCHCPHVAIVLHDFKRIEKVAWILIVGILGVLGKEAWSAMASHLREDGPRGRQGERMYQDRVE